MAYTHLRQVGQVAGGDELVELALPFVVAPQIWIVLVVAAEIHVGQGSQRWVERCHLHLTRGEGVLHWVGYRAYAADVIHQETVVPDGFPSLQYRIENVAIPDAKGCIGGGVVSRPRQYIGSTSRQSRCSRRVV